MTINSISVEELNSLLNQNNFSDKTVIEPNETSKYLKLIKSDLKVNIIKPDNLGCEIYNDMSLQGSTSITRLIEFNHNTTSIIRLIEELLKIFDFVEIAEYWENTYTLKINKKDDISIGLLFGLFDQLKDKFNVGEYSITQTSIEQIFNNFANQDDFNSQTNEEKLGNKKHKPPIIVNQDSIRNIIS